MTPEGLEAYLSSQAGRVQALLEDRLLRLSGRVPPRLLEAMRYSVMGPGKRLRPAICLGFSEAVRLTSGGCEPAEDAACALELVHCYSLVHDDLPAMDDDELRRGRPTTHKVFGEALAILAGDALLTHAFAVLTAGGDPLRLALAHELAEAAGPMGMVAGQALDIAPDRAATEEYLLRLHRLKTGALIRAAARMGVLAAGGAQHALGLATRYGEAVGLAFQIADDLLDQSGTEEELGKPAGADAAAGRATFPAVLGAQAARARAQALVERAMEAAAELEGQDGPLAALARFAVERRR
jgi:geranylgeranyl diphosphate synthase, type II